MAELKWSNVNGSDMTGALEVYRRASNTMYNRTTDLVNGLQNHLGNMQKGKESEYNRIKDENTQNILNQMANADSLSDLDSMVQLADANALRQKYGTQIDMSKINQAKASLASDTYNRANSKDSLLDYDPQAKEVLNQYYQLMASGKPEEATKLVASSSLSNKTKNQIFDTGLEQLNKDRTYHTQRQDKALEIGSEIRKSELAYINAQQAVEQYENQVRQISGANSESFYFRDNPDYQKLVLARDQAKNNYDALYGTYAPQFEQITGTKYQSSIPNISGSNTQPQPQQVTEANRVQQALNNNNQVTTASEALQSAILGVNTINNTLGSNTNVGISKRALEAEKAQARQDNFKKFIPASDQINREIMANPVYADSVNMISDIVSGKAKDTDVAKMMKDPRFLTVLDKAGFPKETLDSIYNGTVSPQSFKAKVKETIDFFNSGEVQENLYATALYGKNLFTGENQSDTSRVLTDVLKNIGTSSVYNSKYAKDASFNTINKESNREANFREFKKQLPYLSQGTYDDSRLESWFAEGLEKGFEPAYLAASLETVINNAMKRTGKDKPEDVLAGIFDYSKNSKTVNDYNTLERLTKDINPNVLSDTTEKARELNRQLAEGGNFMALSVLGGSFIDTDENGRAVGRAMTGSENISQNIERKWGLGGNSVYSVSDTERGKRTAEAIQRQLDSKQRNYNAVSDKYFNHQNKDYDQNLSDEERQILRAEELNRLEAEEKDNLPFLRELALQAREDLASLPKGGSLGNTEKELKKSLSELEKKIKSLEEKQKKSNK